MLAIPGARKILDVTSKALKNSHDETQQTLPFYARFEQPNSSEVSISEIAVIKFGMLERQSNEVICRADGEY